MTYQLPKKTEKAVDSAENLEAVASAIARKGYKAVGRYYSFSDWKQLKFCEVCNLIAAGLTIIAVYEDANDSADDFDEKVGEDQARQAVHLARYHIRQPEGSGIYFAVDYDASQEDYDNHIKPYFEAIKAFFANVGNPYRIGVYGSGLICENALRDRLVELTWLSQSTGFRGYSEYRESNDWNILQCDDPTCADKRPDGSPIGVKISGITFDVDIINLSKGDFGGFSRLEPGVDCKSNCDNPTSNPDASSTDSSSTDDE